VPVVTKRSLAAICVLGLVLAASAFAAARPPIRVVSRPFSLAHGDAVTMTVYDRPPERRDICTMATFANHLKGGGCWWRSQVLKSGSGPAIDGDLDDAWVSGLGPRGTTTAIVRVPGRRFVLRERGPWRAWLVPQALPASLVGSGVSVSYR
jgi:hypothetical protein